VRAEWKMIFERQRQRYTAKRREDARGTSVMLKQWLSVRNECCPYIFHKFPAASVGLPSWTVPLGHCPPVKRRKTHWPYSYPNQTLTEMRGGHSVGGANMLHQLLETVIRIICWWKMSKFPGFALKVCDSKT